MKKHHIIISGTGRSGTTFLIQLLTSLELDTGFENISDHVVDYCNAGMEWEICDPIAPYIIKAPSLSFYIDELLKNNKIVIDHAIIPVRDLFSSAESRRDVTKRVSPEIREGVVCGGIYSTEAPGEEESVLAGAFHNLINTITRNEIPVTFLDFPRIVHDPEYLFRKIKFLLINITYERYVEAFHLVSRPELVHNFRLR